MAWLVAGAVILFLPVGQFRWLGLLPVAYGSIRWHFMLHPQWRYVIRAEPDDLIIGKHSYSWSRFDKFQIERSGTGRSLRLSRGEKEVVIKDDLPGFDDLVQECLAHINRTPQEAEADQTFSDRLSALQGGRRPV
jgi:hypothetical protein